jgi:replicative DNA helicase
METKTKPKGRLMSTDSWMGKVPPNAKELETAVLGAIMLNKSAYMQVVDLLTPECFYVDANQRVFSAMQALYRKSQPIDLLLVVEELRSRGELDEVGGSYYVTRLTNDVVSDANIVTHARIIFQKYIQRRLITLAGGILHDSHDDAADSFDLLDRSTTLLQGLSTEVERRHTVSIPDVSIQVISKLHERVMNAREGRENPNDVYTGLREWDQINGPMKPGLYIVAGRPAMGKGVLMTELVCRMGRQYPVGVINGEMTNEQLLVRIGCNLKGIDNQLWKKDPEWVTDEDLKGVYEAMQETQTLNLHLDDKAYLPSMIAKIRKWVEVDGVKCVMIDFLTLISVHEDQERYMTEVQKLNYIMRTLARMCKDLNLPIILFSQLNRDLYKRGGNKEPNLADLKGAGSVEEYAYQIAFLHRPEYYDILVDELGESTKGLMYLIIAKHRDGRDGRLKYLFAPQFSQLLPWEAPAAANWSPLTDDVPF